MSAAFGIGSIAGGILLGIWGGTGRRILTVLTGLAGLGVGVVAVGIAPAYGYALAAMLFVGLIVPFVNGPIQAILQATIAAEYQGRVFTLIGSLAAMTAPLGLLVAAPVAEMAGVRAWYLSGGIVCFAMGIVGFFLPSLLRIEAPLVEATSPIARDEGASREHCPPRLSLNIRQRKRVFTFDQDDGVTP